MSERTSTTHTYPRSRRLLKPREFVNVLRRAEINLAAGPLRLRAIRNKMPTARLGQVVTKKGNPLAVRRNRIKRIVREEFRLATDLPPVDIVVQVFGALDDAVVRRQIRRQFANLKKQCHALDDARRTGNDARRTGEA